MEKKSSILTQLKLMWRQDKDAVLIGGLTVAFGYWVLAMDGGWKLSQWTEQLIIQLSNLF